MKDTYPEYPTKDQSTLEKNQTVPAVGMYDPRFTVITYDTQGNPIITTWDI